MAIQDARNFAGRECSVSPMDKMQYANHSRC
jgi:hypothetical protein